jgi:hypothetical protein
LFNRLLSFTFGLYADLIRPWLDEGSVQGVRQAVRRSHGRGRQVGALLRRLSRPAHHRGSLLSCMHQPVQPKSLSWWGKVGKSLILQHPPHVQTPPGRIHGILEWGIIILINVPARIRTRDIWLWYHIELHAPTNSTQKLKLMRKGGQFTYTPTLSTLCFRDHQYRMMRSPLLFDMYVEEYAVRRVLRQFGRYHEWPVSVVHTVPSPHLRWVLVNF